MKYVRIYADETGKSLFENVEIKFTERLIVEGVPPVNVSEPLPASALMWVEQSAEAADWENHVAPRRQMVIMTRGRFAVTASNGERREFGAGDALLAEDTIGDGHVSTPLTDDAAFVMIPLA